MNPGVLLNLFSEIVRLGLKIQQKFYFRGIIVTTNWIQPIWFVIPVSFVAVQSLSHIRLFVTPWTIVHQQTTPPPFFFVGLAQRRGRQAILQST